MYIQQTESYPALENIGGQDIHSKTSRGFLHCPVV